MSLSGFIVANYVTANLAYEYTNKQDKKDLAEDIKLITNKARALRSKIGERERFVCDSGVWFLTKGEDNLVYALCVSQDYPERLAFGFIKKVEALIKQKKIESNVQKGIKKHQKEFAALCEKHKDAKADKVRQAQHAVGELRDELQTGIGKVLSNQDNLQNLTEKTSLMKNYAKQFQKQAQVVEQKAFCHKFKIYFIIGTIIGSVLIFSGLIVYLRMK